MKKFEAKFVKDVSFKSNECVGYKELLYFLRKRETKKEEQIDGYYFTDGVDELFLPKIGFSARGVQRHNSSYVRISDKYYIRVYMRSDEMGKIRIELHKISGMTKKWPMWVVSKERATNEDVVNYNVATYKQVYAISQMTKIPIE